MCRMTLIFICALTGCNSPHVDQARLDAMLKNGVVIMESNEVGRIAYNRNDIDEIINKE